MTLRTIGRCATRMSPRSGIRAHRAPRFGNPSNPDVRGVPVRRIRQLFPDARLRVWPVTLAPPIARRVVRIHPALYGVLNLTPLLRSHVLCWAQKPG